LGGGAPPSVLRRSALHLQRTAGNRAVSRLLGKGVQREIMAYTREHSEILPGDSEGAAIMSERSSAEAPRLTNALQALITAGKVRATTAGDRTWFANVSAVDAEIRTALTAGGLPKVNELTDALLSNHNVFVFAGNKVTEMTTLFGTTELGRERDAVTRQTSRLPTAYEREQANRVFGASLNLDRVKIEEDPVMTFGFGFGTFARTTWFTVNMPPGSLNRSDPGLMTWLIHEFTHLWQYQHGASIVGTTCRAIVGGPYAYGGDTQLVTDHAAGKRFKDYNYEQQGDICADYYERLISGGSTTAHQPFIDQVRTGG
jgi:hypothetical protein